jgi:ribosomal protein S18 acetylase RimI-like enzyme
MVKTGSVDITWATSPVQLGQVRELFLEYAESLGFSLCFQGFDKELAQLPGMYAPPEGRLLLGMVADRPAGCAGLHKLEGSICEMKRLYVPPPFRGIGLGRRLAGEIIAEARAIGYRKIRLDTIVGKMDQAIELYRQLGFREIDPYRPNPIPGALYMELEL